MMVGTGLLMGTLFSFQSKSVSQANQFINRESRVNIFKEIQIVKKSNQDLNEQANELQKELANGSNKEQVLENIKKDIAKYQLAIADSDITGTGIKILIDGELEALWFTDLINELFSAGAEAVSVNGIRMIDRNSGFDTMPNGQILFGGEILSAPFKFEVIGDSKTILGSMTQTGGIISRIKDYRPKYNISVSKESVINMPKVAVIN